MLELVAGFVEELRRVGIPVSMVESIDALKALAQVNLADRGEFRETLRATLIKNPRHDQAFEAMFGIFFAARSSFSPEVMKISTGTAEASEIWASSVPGDVDGLRNALEAAILSGDIDALKVLARQAVESLAEIDTTRPVGATYYFFKALRELDLEALERVLGESDDPELEALRRLIRENERTELLEFFRRQVAEEIQRTMVNQRGVQSIARQQQQKLIEQTDIMHAVKGELEAIEAIIEPLTRKLVARLTRKRRRYRRGRLDFRKTMRASLSTGGVPLEPRFKSVRPHRPELFLLCDVSGSMATFARFALQFTYAMTTQFSKLRAFVFIDAVDEVTHVLGPGVDFVEAIARIEDEADIVWLDGHSDYGTALQLFEERYGKDLTPRSTVIITGDARNNYREPRPGTLAAISDRVQGLYWLNPEPRAYWDTGDSVMARYAPMCDNVFEVRTLQQLEEFVEWISETRFGSSRSRTAPFKNGLNTTQSVPMLGGSPRFGGFTTPYSIRPAAER